MPGRLTIAAVIGCILGLGPFVVAWVLRSGTAPAWFHARNESLLIPGPVEVAAPLAVLVSIVVAGAVIVQDWQGVQFRAAAGLIFAALLGLPLGLILLARADDHLVRLLLGSVIILFSVYSLVIGRSRNLANDHAGWLMACGFASGVLGGAYGMNGPPLAIYGALRKWSPQHFRATLEAYFLPVSLMGLAGYAALGLWTATVTRYFLWSLPGVGVATVAGRFINQRIEGDRFITVVYGGLVGSEPWSWSRH
ncbi:MAG TPA: sulfite exporter TauE/SafE family protein [Vicinamibacterales bacterium]